MSKKNQKVLIRFLILITQLFIQQHLYNPIKIRLEIDEATRRKNIEIHLNELEKDNYQEIPELEIVTGTISKPRRVSDLADTSQRKLCHIFLTFKFNFF